MPNKMLIDATHPEETRVVVLRGNRVEEFDFESANRKQLRGNIYLAKVTRVEPSLQAAFVDYGGNRHGFLAFSEIHPDYYQIPVADRQALIAEEEREQRAADVEADHRAGAGAARAAANARHAGRATRSRASRSNAGRAQGAHGDDERGEDRRWPPAASRCCRSAARTTKPPRRSPRRREPRRGEPLRGAERVEPAEHTDESRAAHGGHGTADADRADEPRREQLRRADPDDVAERTVHIAQIGGGAAANLDEVAGDG